MSTIVVYADEFLLLRAASALCRFVDLGSDFTPRFLKQIPEYLRFVNRPPSRVGLFIAVAFVQAALLEEPADGEKASRRGGSKPDKSCVPRSPNSKVHDDVSGGLNSCRPSSAPVSKWLDVLAVGVTVRDRETTSILRVDSECGDVTVCGAASTSSSLECGDVTVFGAATPSRASSCS